jgi:hypothetical protein
MYVPQQPNTSAAAGQLACMKHSPGLANQLKTASGPPKLPALATTFTSALRHEGWELQPIAGHLLLLEGLAVQLLALHTDLCKFDLGEARPACHTAQHDTAQHE